MLGDLFYGRGPFDTQPLTPSSRASASTNEAYLGYFPPGLPPPDLLSRGRESDRYFDERGPFRFPELIGEKRVLVSIAEEIDKEDEIPEFVDFIPRMLRWKPEDRSTAVDLLSNPWLP